MPLLSFKSSAHQQHHTSANETQVPSTLRTRLLIQRQREQVPALVCLAVWQSLQSVSLRLHLGQQTLQTARQQTCATDRYGSASDGQQQGSWQGFVKPWFPWEFWPQDFLFSPSRALSCSPRWGRAACHGKREAWSAPGTEHLLLLLPVGSTGPRQAAPTPNRHLLTLRPASPAPGLLKPDVLAWSIPPFHVGTKAGAKCPV